MNKKTEKLTILLNWPSKELWVNRNRGHNYHVVSDQKGEALHEGCMATLQALNGQPKPDWRGVRLALTIEAHKQNRAPFDLDNLTGALKAHIDGIAATLGVNDNQIDRITVIRGAPDKDPYVMVTVDATQAAQL